MTSLSVIVMRLLSAVDTPSIAKFFSISQPMAPHPTLTQTKNFLSVCRDHRTILQDNQESTDL